MQKVNPVPGALSIFFPDRKKCIYLLLIYKELSMGDESKNDIKELSFLYREKNEKNMDRQYATA